MENMDLLYSGKFWCNNGIDLKRQKECQEMDGFVKKAQIINPKYS